MHNPRRARWFALAAITGLVLGNFFLHKPISDVCDWARASWGFPLYDRVALFGIPLITLFAAWPWVRHEAARWRELSTWCVALSLAAMTLATQRWMLVANIELIHFPQFGIIAALALVGGLAAEPAWLLATLAGIVDETYQQLVIYAGRADTYLDFNDMVLDAIGAAWVVVLLAPRQPPASTWLRWPRAATWLLPLTLLAIIITPPRFTPFLRPTLGGNPYRVIGLSEALLWASMLWGFVALSTTERPNRHPGERRDPGGWLPRQIPTSANVAPANPGIVEVEKHFKRLDSGFRRNERKHICCAAALLTLLHSCAAWRPHVVANPVTPPFITTFWCGPPLAELDDARAAEIAAAGFTIIGAPCEGAITPALNRRALDVAARHGLRMWVMDHRFNPYASDQPDIDQIAAAVAEYRHHPAFGGYFVWDEPTVEMVDTVNLVVDALHTNDPEHVAYVNLLPDYVPASAVSPVAESGNGGDARGGTTEYAAYVDRFIATMHPRLLSYDYYPFGKEKDRSTFFSNLTLMRDRALQHHIPLLLIVLAMPHGPYREPTEAELAWQVFHALAYGARGISYFAYWTPVHVEHADQMQFHYGLIENDQPTAMYFRAQRLNRAVRAIAAQLDGYHSVTVADARGDIAPPLPVGPLAAVDGGDVTIGFFADHHDQLAALVVNRDYKYGANVVLRLREGARLPQAFDAEHDCWNSMSTPSIVLAPGEGQLLRWTHP